MIFDRTINDVRTASELRKSKVQKNIALSDSEKEIMERGTLSYDTLNRIELKQEELMYILRQMGYYVIINNKRWTGEDIFTDAEFERIVENNAALRKAFFVYPDSPMNAVARYHYSEFNALEKILHDLEQMIAYTKNEYRECGTFECGG